MTSPLQQKIKLAGPSVVTANRLADGAVVYRTPDQQWTTSLDSAAIVDERGAADDLLAKARADNNRSVDVYLAPVTRARDGRVQPGNLRELIRLNGPTIELPITFGI